MLTLKQYIAEQIERRLLNIEIFEMAISRKEFIRKFSGYAWQVAINYVLIRYCSELIRYCSEVDNYYDTRVHWCKELINNLNSIYLIDISKDNKEHNIQKRAIRQAIEDYDIDDEDKLLRLMKTKILEEERSTEHLKHIDWNMDIIKKLCGEFSEKCEEIFMLIYKYKNVEDLENYIYNEL